jgi:hypothetical protein
MAYKTVYTEVEVDVNISDFDTEDLLDELENRGYMTESSSKELLEAVYMKRRVGMDYQSELDQLIYALLGNIV